MAAEWFAALRQETERLRAFMPEDLPLRERCHRRALLIFTLHLPVAFRDAQLGTVLAGGDAVKLAEAL